jgi:ABC-type dipeptide/oligopeptide/nickel transport system permease component
VQGLAGYIIRRLSLVPVILFVVSVVAFSLGRLAPSDYVETYAGGRSRPDIIERIREERGLNDPIPQQYVRYIGNFVTGDLGESVVYRGQSVEDVIAPRIWVSFQYNIVVLLLTFAIGLPVGTWAAIKRGTWMDPFSIGSFLLFASVPVVVSIPLLQWLLAIKLDLLPAAGWHERDILGVKVGILSKEAILPILVLTLPGVAGLARYMRSQVIDVLDQDYVRTARAKGLEEFVVVSRHTVRNALLPIATIMGFELAALFSGSIIAETFLGIPGIGRYAFETVNARDYDGIMAIVILGSITFMLANLAVDVAYGFIDPRVRYGQAGQRA